MFCRFSAGLMSAIDATLQGRQWERWRSAVVVVLAAALAAAMLGDAYTVAVIVVLGLAATGIALFPLSRSLPVIVFLIPFRLYIDIPGTMLELALTNFIIVGLGAVCIGSLMLRGRPRLVGWEFGIVLWLLWTVASLAWSSERVASLTGVFRWMMVFSAILIASQCVLRSADPPAAARRLLMALLSLVGFWSIVGFIEVAVGIDPIFAFLKSPAAAVFYPPLFLQERLAARNFNWLSGNSVQPFGAFLNAIEFGILTAVGVGSALALAVGRRALAPRWLVVGVLILASAANVASMKGTGWLAAGVAVAMAFISLGRSIRRVVGISLLTLVVLGLLIYIFRETLVERVQSLAAREGAEGAAAQALSRPAIWSYYLTGLLSHPITGGGVSTAILHGPVHWTIPPSGGTSVAVVLPTENSYLTTAIETGLVGLALLLTTVIGALVRGLRLARRHPDLPLAQAAGTAAIGLAAILAGNLTVDAFNGEILGVLMGILIGIIVAANRLVPRTRPTGS
jgi:O-antigen ligase